MQLLLPIFLYYFFIPLGDFILALEELFSEHGVVCLFSRPGPFTCASWDRQC